MHHILPASKSPRENKAAGSSKRKSKFALAKPQASAFLFENSSVYLMETPDLSVNMREAMFIAASS